jgi:hypothetical protein
VVRFGKIYDKKNENNIINISFLLIKTMGFANKKDINICW